VSYRLGMRLRDSQHGIGAKARELNVLARTPCVPSDVSRETLAGTPGAAMHLRPATARRSRPPESRDSEARFGHSDARLSPFIDNRAWTLQGAGVLLSVYAKLCEGHPEWARKPIRIRREDVVINPVNGHMPGTNAQLILRRRTAAVKPRTSKRLNAKIL